MPVYDIKRWDAVLPEGNVQPMPMIYIKPNKDFLKFAKKNNYMVIATIKNSNTVYDDQNVVAIIDCSKYFPNYRPLFYDETGLITITLFAHWDGYPPNLDKLGKISLDGVEEKKEEIEQQEKKEKYKNPLQKVVERHVQSDRQTKCNNLSANQISWIMLTILIIFGIFLYISLKK